MRKVAILLWACALIAQAQVFPQPERRWRAVGVGALASRPATCEANRDVYVCNGAGCAANGTYFYCVATNTWSEERGAGDITAVGDCATGDCFQTAAQNSVLAGLATGGAGQASMRALVDADIPAAIARDSEINVQGTAKDLRFYGAVCDGSNVATAAEAAIAAGHTRLFLPAGCVWRPAGNLVPAGIEVYGEDRKTSIVGSNDQTLAWITVGSGGILRNIGIQDRFCYEVSPPENMAKTCEVGHYQNASDASYIPGVWKGQHINITYGPTVRVEADKAVTGAANNGSGLIRLTIANHGYETGQHVVVQNVGGVPNATKYTPANAYILAMVTAWVVTRIDANTIDLQGSTWGGAYTSGGTAYRAAHDLPGMVMSQVSVGDGYYGQILSPGIAFRAEVKTPYDVSVGSGDGFAAIIYPDAYGRGIRVTNQSANAWGMWVQREEGSGSGMFFDTRASAGDEIVFTTGSKTSGSLINAYQATSLYSGAAIALNFTNFNGAFLVFQGNGVTRMLVDSVGNIILGPTSAIVIPALACPPGETATLTVDQYGQIGRGACAP